MDKDDLRDYMMETKITKLHNRRFKINFIWIFILCILIMILDQLMKYLDYLPELFNGSNYVFHILQSIVNIVSQLSVSVASAIIFYYVLEFINAKKKIQDLREIRKYILFILYTHMEIICNTPSFNSLNRNLKRLSIFPKMFLYDDIPILLRDYDNYDEEKLKIELNNYFFETHQDDEKRRQLILTFDFFKEKMTNLYKYKDFTFYKDFNEDIEGLKSIIDDMNECLMCYENKKDMIYFQDIIDNYITFLNESINIYCFMETYILCLEDKHFIQFMKMLY